MTAFAPLATIPLASLPSVAGDVEKTINQSILFSQQVDHNIKPESVSDSILFSQQVDVVREISRPASNAIVFSDQADHNFKLESVSNSILFSQLTENNYKFESVSNAIVFNQQVLDNFKLESVNQSLTFNQQVDVAFELNLAVGNSLTFFDWVDTNIIEVVASNSFIFSQTAESASSTFERGINQSIQFDQKAARTFEESVAQSITFSQDASQEHPAENTLTFSQLVVADVGPHIQQALAFSQQVDIEIESNKVVSDSIVFSQTAIGIIENRCDLHEYTPHGSFPAAPTLGIRTAIRLDDGSTQLDLRNPLFGNTDRVETFQQVNRSRGGTYNLFAAATWPKNTIQQMTVSELTRVEAQAVLDFYQANRGTEVTFIDQENRSWTVILLNAGSDISDQGGSGNSVDCRNTVSLEFIGDPV